MLTLNIVSLRNQNGSRGNRFRILLSNLVEFHKIWIKLFFLCVKFSDIPEFNARQNFRGLFLYLNTLSVSPSWTKSTAWVFELKNFVRNDAFEGDFDLFCRTFYIHVNFFVGFLPSENYNSIHLHAVGWSTERFLKIKRS